MSKTVLYDLSAECELSPEDMEVVSLVRSKNHANLSDKVVVTDGERIYIETRKEPSVLPFVALGLARLVGTLSLIAVALLILWAVLNSAKALLIITPIAVWLWDTFYGGRNLCPKLN